MKTLLCLSLYIFPHFFICTASVDCREIGGTVPVDVYNSPYTILPNGSLCCPEYIGNSCNKDEKAVATECPGGLVYEPCHFCKTCAKLLGMVCGGHQSQYGKCLEGLECIASNKNATGICYVEGMLFVLRCPPQTCIISLSYADCNGVSFLYNNTSRAFTPNLL